MKKKNYRKRQVYWTLLSLLLLIGPLLGWVIARRDIYFSDGEQTKIGIGFFITLAFILAALKGAFKNYSQTLNTIIWLGVFLAISWFLQSILNDLFWILLMSICGYLMYMPFEYLAKINKRKADVVLDEKVKQEVRGNYGGRA